MIKRKIVLDPKLELQCILSCVKLFVSIEVVKFGLLLFVNIDKFKFINNVCTHESFATLVDS